MSAPVHKEATYEDLLRVPPNKVAEIVNGRLHTHPRPGPRHAGASSRLGVHLGGPFDLGSGGPGGWWILDEPELHLGPHVLVPDLAGWRRERMPVLPDTAWFETAPDWVCEILSSSTARLDRAEKMPIYLEAGVSHAWLVDPEIHVLEAYEARQAHWIQIGVYKNDDPISVTPFDAIEFGLDTLWVG